MILVNGFPKSGTHALQKACNLLGYDTLLDHIPCGTSLPEGMTKHLLIYRDPRNAVISWIRMRRMQVTEGMIMSTCMSRIPDMRKFSGWLKDESVQKFRFEDLITKREEMERLAFVLDRPYIAGAFEDLPGHTRTWSGEGTTSAHSDFTKYWTAGVSYIWSQYGGDILTDELGYEKWKS